MADPDYWKNQYKGNSWEIASRRAAEIISLIKRTTKKNVVPVGLGEGSTEFLPGNAKNYGHEKGEADLHVSDTNIYIEITGPQTKSVTADAALWIRPDKIENAHSHYPKHETWVVHYLERDGTKRVIRLNKNFFRLVDNAEFQTVTPNIRGAQETYIEIPADHECVQPWEVLIERIKKA
jgi:hypothetical protein